MKNSIPTTIKASLVAGACLVVATLGITSVWATGSAAPNQDQNPPRIAVDQSAVAAWAGTTGVDLSALAEWAEANNMVGSSPTSLRRAPEASNNAVDQAGVAEWAEANGLSGLSPASVGANSGG